VLSLYLNHKIMALPGDSCRRATIRTSSVLHSLPQPRQNATVKAATAAENLATHFGQSRHFDKLPEARTLVI
jgi:hypothetical protein